jgi:4-hydroxybenzoate polyprenyltransferase
LRSTSFTTQFGLPRLKLFLALSRTPHGLLDMATPSLSALLWLGKFPSVEVIVLGLLTAFSGYTAVYALNDVMDWRIDRQKIGNGGPGNIPHDLDAIFIRHPIAHGKLGVREGFFWVGVWSLFALIGCFLLNPICTWIFLAACILEVFYCLLLRVTYLRGIFSGLVKNSGGIAAVFAVDPNPSPLFLLVLFCLAFFWEIGGQNIPNDWMDMEEDKNLQAQTIPVRLGSQGSLIIILISLLFTVGLSVTIFWVSPGLMEIPFCGGAILAGLYFLLLPTYRLWKEKSSVQAAKLFNRASYYPMAMLFVTIFSWRNLF